MTRAPSGRVVLSLVALAVAEVGLAGGAGCTNGSSLASNAKGPVTCAPGAANLGPCCGQVALERTASTLSVDTCSGSSAYSLCNGASFDCEYVCALPPGYAVVSATDAHACVEAGRASDAPSREPVPFDAGGLALGPCSGKVVALIAASSCPDHCAGSVAYAVCSGGVYGACACDIPPGYTLTSLVDAGAAEASTDAAVDASGDAGLDGSLAEGGKDGGAG